MQKNLLDKKDKKEKNTEILIRKYLQDIQNHFGITNTELIKVLKSCISHLKRNDITKKWWKFF